MQKRIKKASLDGLLSAEPRESVNNQREKQDVSSADVPAPKKKRLPQIFKDKTEGPAPDLLPSGGIDIADLLAPSSADLTHKDYVVVDGIYHAYLYVAGYGYATTVGNGWLSSLVEAGEGVNVSYRIDRQPKDKILSKISQTTMINRSRMRDVEDVRQDYEELDSAINAGLYMKDAINRNNEDLYYIHTLIEITAGDAETLERRVERIRNLCVAQDMLCKRADYLHEQGFTSFLPVLATNPDLERKMRRNALTSGAAAAFPFSSYEVFDEGGIPLGLMQHNRSLCMPNFYDTSKYSNGNIFITGFSGTGKTYLLSIITLLLRLQDVKVILIAPLKGYEYRVICEEAGGSYIKLSPSSEDCINLLAIRRLTLHNEDGVTEARTDSLLADKIQKVHTFMKLRKRDMTEYEEHLIDAALVELYGRFGITYDNESVIRPDGTIKSMPTLADFHDLLAEKDETRLLASTISRYATGSARTMGGATNVDLSSKFTVIDISELPEDLLPEWMYVATDYSFDVCSESRLEKKALILDELWYLLGGNSNALAANFVLRIFKIIRGMSGIAVAATQDVSDLFSLADGAYGKGILNNTRIKFIFPLEESEMRVAQEKLDLTDEEVMQLSRNRRGECLFSVGKSRVSLTVHTTQLIHSLITTDRSELLRRAQLHSDA
ncbi:hypothetical protein LJC32_03690 [Oscillospiraceae bacterium OttesenSCG-928-F05]|nr:hypothetical protein [Oscillospiraceae bacterium OttesenSCG-928-F05]